MRHESVLLIPTHDAEEAQRLLDTDVAIPDCGHDGIYQTWSGSFKDGTQFDIKVVNTDNGPYVDAVLFDEKGHEISVCEPAYTLLGNMPGLSRMGR